MFRALLYLRLTSLKNLLLARLRRLRQPKYLVGALFAVGYFYLLVFRQTRTGFAAAGAAGGIAALPADTHPLVLGIASLALGIFVVGMWLLPSDRPGLAFTEPEIAFLFPAPISRRALVQYRVASSLFVSLLQTLFFTVMFNGRSLLSGRAVPLLISWWLVLSFVTLHNLGASLTIARLAERGVDARRRRSVIFIGLLAVVALAVIWISRTMPSVLLAPSLAEWCSTALTTGALGWLLRPLHLLLNPFFAKGVSGFVLAVLPAMGLLALEYFWVVRTNVAFEEASIARAERRAAVVAELRRSGTYRLHPGATKARRDPFDLNRVRWPEFAFLWKNLLSTRSWFTVRTWCIAATVMVGLSAVLHRLLGTQYWMAGGALATIGTLGVFACVAYGPLLTRLDLRQDLPNADILKAYPLPGWRIVLGELLAPTVVLTGFVWLGLLAWFLGLQGHQPPKLSPIWFSPETKVVWCLCVGATTPFILCLELLIPNATPVLLPGWFQTIRAPGGGIDLMGQRMIFGFGQIALVALALGLAVAVATGVHFMVGGVYALHAWIHHTEIGAPSPAATLVVWMIVMILVLLGEIVSGVWWIGRRFERLDVTEARS